MRAPSMERMLEKAGKCFYVMELQGYIFFGMAHKLLDKVKDRINDKEQTPLKYLLLDFRLVTGLDSSASYAFSRIAQIADQNNIIIALANLDSGIKQHFDFDKNPLLIFDDIDHAISWFDEAEIKRQAEQGSHFEPVQLIQYFQSAIPDEDTQCQLSTVERLQRFMQLESVPSGSVLLQENNPVDVVYFIESGAVSAQTTLTDGSTKRLRVLGAGSVVGEIGIYTGALATATVVVIKDAELFGLSAKELRRMESEDPALAVAAHRLIATTLGRKLTQLNNALFAKQK